MNLNFTPEEHEAMTSARLAVFHGAIILDAQPPIGVFKKRRVGGQCEGALPTGLVELWRTAFGGTLDYDLRATFGTQVARLSFRQLFFPDSDHYFDLDGWIAHEREIADGKKLVAMPFGGFESDERLYALTRLGADHGAVVAGTEGLAWPGYVERRGLTTVAVDVPSLFRTLWLEADPEASPDDSAMHGRETLTQLETLSTQGTHGRSAAAKMKTLLRSRILDWRAAFDANTLKQQPILTMLALEFAAEHDDLQLLERIEGQGISTMTPLRGSGTVFELAAACGSVGIVTALLDRHPARDAIRYGATRLPTSLLEQLIARGAVVDNSALRWALRGSDDENALLLLRHADTGFDVGLAVAARKRANTARSAGKTDAADRFDAFADRVDPSVLLR